MLAVLSPAKKLDMEKPAPISDYSQPEFMTETEELVAVLRHMSREELGGLMKLSDKLTELNYDRYRRFDAPFTLSNAKQAAYAFQGDTYVGFDAESLSTEDMIYAQDHVRVLSGLYGLLRPLDLMHAYRLEMGTPLKNPKGKNLYNFWGDKLTAALKETVKDDQNPVVINLASHEYSKALAPEKLGGGMITPHFKEMKEDGPKVIGLYAKRARGAMARYMVENRIENPEDLKDFDIDGYQFQPKASNDTDWVFLRA